MLGKPPSGAVTTIVSLPGGMSCAEVTIWAVKASKSTEPTTPSPPKRSVPTMVTCVPAPPVAGVIEVMVGAVAPGQSTAPTYW